MERLKLGDYNTLEIVKEVDFGLYLDGGEYGEILLPARYVPETYAIGQAIEVFLYLDSEERLIATTEQPLARVGDFAFLRCSWVNRHGAFLHWGLMKDLFCPFGEQRARMEVGRSYMVHVHIDHETSRIMASAKLDRYLNASPPPYGRGDEVGIMVWHRTDLGYKVIVDNEYQGLVYANQMFRTIYPGDRLTGYVDGVRSDGKIDIALQRTGRQQTVEFAHALYQYLKDNGGSCPLGDKSDAEEIKRVFQVSKKTFKKAVGDLYRKRLITISEDGIALTGEGEFRWSEFD